MLFLFVKERMDKTKRKHYGAHQFADSISLFKQFF